ncbi:MAG: hypothetical protein C5B47_06120 [Verrucomicrobia bacterium]|nr:MAG: hypothetical protein C5B47_06120 [Verrucomicrobiota bacterium]
MECELTHFSAPDGERFTWQKWVPPGKLRAAMIAIHGMGAAASDFAPLGELLLKEKMAVYAPNLRGQGLDPLVDRRGRELNVEQLLADVAAVVGEVRQDHPKAPLLFYGESMGALLLIRLLAADQHLFPIAGAILAVPVVELARPTPPIVRSAVQLVAKYLPSLTVLPQWFVNRKEKHTLHLSHDRDKQRSFENAPYLIKRFTASFINNMGLLISSANEAAERIRHPILVLGAGDDEFIYTDQLLQWFDRVGSTDKTLEIFPNSYHRLLFDQDQPEVEKALLNWLRQRF